jgi:hypothetical protein
MKSPHRSLAPSNKWLDWRRPDIQDSVFVLGVTALAWTLAHHYELGPRLFQLGHDYAEWELDDIIFVVYRELYPICASKRCM